MPSVKQNPHILKMAPNWYKPVIHIEHSSLIRSSPESCFRSKCPACKEGILPVGRDQKTLDLIREDHCLFCGQHFYYTDEPFFDI